jgi:hypothetical protein
MVGYPSYVVQGIMVKALFNPAIRFGGKINVTSTQKPACGIWAVYSLEYDLDANTPGGAWFTLMGAYNPNFTPPVIR